MKTIKDFVKRNLQLILYIMCGVLVLSGIAITVFGGRQVGGFVGVMLTLFGIVLVAIGAALAFLACVAETDEPANYFLYDSKTKTNISLEELDFDTVNHKMTVVMADLVSSAAKVWTENVFETRKEVFETDGVYVPLVAYKMLYDLADRADESIWTLYLMAPTTLIDSIADALAINADTQMGDAFKILHKKADGSYERTEKFLTDNKKYIQNKMLKYVKNNINKF